MGELGSGPREHFSGAVEPGDRASDRRLSQTPRLIALTEHGWDVFPELFLRGSKGALHGEPPRHG